MSLKNLSINTREITVDQLLPAHVDKIVQDYNHNVRAMMAQQERRRISLEERAELSLQRTTALAAVEAGK